MKKTGVIFLCIFYFAVACGFSVNLHYCAGKLKGVSLVQSEEGGCCGTKKRSKGCCKEKTLVYKVNVDHHSASKVLLPNKLSKNLFVSFAFNSLRIQKPVIELYAVAKSNAPPFFDPEPVYLLNRNFRI